MHLGTRARQRGRSMLPGAPSLSPARAGRDKAGALRRRLDVRIAPISVIRRGRPGCGADVPGTGPGPPSKGSPNSRLDAESTATHPTLDARRHGEAVSDPLTLHPSRRPALYISGAKRPARRHYRSRQVALESARGRSSTRPDFDKGSRDAAVAVLIVGRSVVRPDDQLTT
jgi:hypothetical protein